jgi:pimeloyl-ACP methyl ester carboxylesterase
MRLIALILGTTLLLTGPSLAQTSPPSTIRVGDIQIAYRILGKGEPLVLIMGFAGVMDMWDPVFLRQLAARYQVIVFDNRGMGGSTAPPGPFSIEQFAADTAGLMDALNVPKAHILGYSMGTYVAQELVLRYPGKVNRLILYAADCGGPEAIDPSDDVLRQLYDTSGTPEERGRRLIRLLIPDDWLRQNEAYVRAVFFSRPIAPSPPQNVARQASAMERWPGACGRLREIRSPTLLVTGMADVITPPQNSVMMARVIRGAELGQIPGGGHGVMYQWPVRLGQLVRSFLQ